MPIGRVSLARENEAWGSWGQKSHFSSVERWGSVLVLATLIAAASVNVLSIGFRKMKSNGSCGRNFAGKNDYHFLSKTIFIAFDSVLSPSTTFVTKPKVQKSDPPRFSHYNYMYMPILDTLHKRLT